MEESALNHLLNPVTLSRIQFAFTVSFHILFPAFTIGLASWLAVLEFLWLKTSRPIYKEIYKFWVKIFAVTFAMGVVSGVVLSYQIGTNWSGFSDKVGNVLGPLLGFEVLTAFFLESSFLGIMLFGWERVSRKMHFTATVVVALGTLISAFWILAANSWMQTPQGFEIKDANIFYPVNWMEIIFNPSFPYRMIHMVLATYLTTAFVVSGVASWYFLKAKYQNHAKIMLFMSMLMACLVTPLQVIVGDLHGLNTLKHQPAKIAAIEAFWKSGQAQPLTLFGLIDEKNETTKFAIEIPKIGSLILTHDSQGEIQGLDHWPKSNRPPVAPLFYAFRIMVGLGILMLLTGVIAFVLFLKKRLYTTSWFHKWCVLMTPAGFIAILSGWIVTEMGRQPFVVYNLVRTTEAVSPVLSPNILISLIAFIVVYLFIFGAGIYYILTLIQKGPVISDEKETFGDHSINNPPLLNGVKLDGSKHA